MKYSVVNVVLLIQVFVEAVQELTDESADIQVNSGDDIILKCIIKNKSGECRWKKDGIPVGMFDNKYEWAGDENKGDCSLLINNASEEYDIGLWQCQVTATDFTQKDSLLSKGSFLSITRAPKTVILVANGVTYSNGSVIDLEDRDIVNFHCEVHGGDPGPHILWNINDTEARSQQDYLYIKANFILLCNTSYSTNMPRLHNSAVLVVFITLTLLPMN